MAGTQISQELHRGPGRPPGSTNYIAGQIRDMVYEALTQVGGIEWLVKQAKKNPIAFMGLISRLLPPATKAALGEDEDGKLVIQIAYFNQANMPTGSLQIPLQRAPIDQIPPAAATARDSAAQSVGVPLGCTPTPTTPNSQGQARGVLVDIPEGQPSKTVRPKRPWET